MGQQESLEVEFVAGGNRAALVQQAHGGQARFRAGIGQGLEFQAVLVRLVGQFEHLAPEHFRQFATRQHGRPFGTLGGFPCLAFDGGLGGGEHIRRRGPVTALALLVEINGGAMQSQQDGRGFGAEGFVAVVLPSQILETEFRLAGDFPEEIQVQFLFRGSSLLHDLGRRRRGIT
jgi:hypothetical protein